MSNRSEQAYLKDIILCMDRDQRGSSYVAQSVPGNSNVIVSAVNTEIRKGRAKPERTRSHRDTTKARSPFADEFRRQMPCIRYIYNYIRHIVHALGCLEGVT